MANQEAPVTVMKVRFGITQSSPEAKARISLETQQDGLISSRIDGDETLGMYINEKLTDIAEGISKTIPTAERFAIVRDAVRKGLEEESLIVEEIADSDVQYRFEIDLETGMSIGTEAVLHEYTDPNAEISRNIHAALQEAFQQGPKQLINEIELKVAANDHVGAAEAVINGVESGRFFGHIPPELLTALQKINISELNIEARELISKCILDTALLLKRYDVAEYYANYFIAVIDPSDKNRHAFLKNIIALASLERDELETAILIWEEILKTPEDIEPGNRGWIWNNYGMALSENDSKAKRALKLSIDAFIEAGDKHQAGRRMMHLSHMLSHEDPNLAINQLDDILKTIDQNGLLDSEIRASIQHHRAKKLNDLRSYVHAFSAANEAVILRRGKIGLEQELIASLNLASITAQFSGNQEAAESLEKESIVLETSLSSKFHDIARRVITLTSQYDSEYALSLLAEAKAFGSQELMHLIDFTIAQLDPSLNTVARIRRLESTLSELQEDDRLKLDIMMAIGKILSNEGQYSRALIWFHRVLEKNPFSLEMRERVIDCHWKNENWHEAAVFIKDQINRFGELPNLLFAYGRSLVKAGNYSDGISALSKARQGLNDTDPLYNTITELRDHALDAGGTVLPVVVPPPSENTVIVEEVHAALNEFSKFIAADKRMRFWILEPEDKDYQWIQNPEKLAQDFLHIYLKAKFQNRILVLEELTTGAGRLDVFLQFSGGLSVIVEIKMCGFRYSSAYAASGEDQIRHYMDNRNTHLGFLLVFDSRLNEHSESLLQNISDGVNTVHEVYVDLRPRVGKTKKAKKTKG
jgi:tetratricopeptide (TPR) repeat protein